MAVTIDTGGDILGKYCCAKGRVRGRIANDGGRGGFNHW